VVGSEHTLMFRVFIADRDRFPSLCSASGRKTARSEQNNKKEDACQSIHFQFSNSQTNNTKTIRAGWGNPPEEPRDVHLLFQHFTGLEVNLGKPGVLDLTLELAVFALGNLFLRGFDRHGTRRDLFAAGI